MKFDSNGLTALGSIIAGSITYILSITIGSPSILANLLSVVLLGFGIGLIVMIQSVVDEQ